MRGNGRSQCLWSVVFHPAAFIEHLLCAAGGEGHAWGWETERKPHTVGLFSPKAHRARPKLYLTEVISLSWPLTPQPFLCPFRTELCFGPRFTFKSPESHGPLNRLSYSVSTELIGFPFFLSALPTVATICTHVFNA